MNSMATSYGSHGRMVAHNMVTTQFELDGFRVVRTLGVVRGIVVRFAFDFRHDWRQPANHSRWQHNPSNQPLRENSG